MINTLLVVIEAYSLPENRTLWKATMCPTIPPVLSKDGTAIYSFDCSGSLVAIDTATSETIWRLAELPAGFTPASLVLAGKDDDPRLLLVGQVLPERKGYAYAVYTQGATLSPTPVPSVSTVPTAAPVEPVPTVSPGISSAPVAGPEISSSPVADRSTSGAGYRRQRLWFVNMGMFLVAVFAVGIP